MSNISTIATYLARVSGQLQPMLEKVRAWTAEPSCWKPPPCWP
ncbi:MAG: hypothetical protein ACLT8E_04540 [Akkermansia sp.]